MGGLQRAAVGATIVGGSGSRLLRCGATSKPIPEQTWELRLGVVAGVAAVAIVVGSDSSGLRPCAGAPP